MLSQALYTNEGMLYLDSLAFQGVVFAGPYYIGLCSSTGLAVTSTLASITGEPIGNNYGRKAVARDATTSGFPTLEINTDGASEATAKKVTFTATGGDWSAVDTWFLANVASGTTGKLIACGPLSELITIRNGASEDITLKLKRSNKP